MDISRAIVFFFFFLDNDKLCLYLQLKLHINMITDMNWTENLRLWNKSHQKVTVALFPLPRKTAKTLLYYQLTYKVRVTVVMNKTDYHDKMDALVNDKQTYEELKRDPTPTLQRKLNSKILTLKKTDAIDTQRYYRLRCSVPQPLQLYGLPKLHKPGFPMRPILSLVLWVSDVPTVQIPDDYTTTAHRQI